MKRRQHPRLVVALFLAMGFVASGSDDTTDLAKDSQNPVSDLISVLIE